jgi:glycosyltransferase involved in cell wall biosynthesis
VARVCIPIEFQPQGGGFYFLLEFERYLESIGWSVTRDPRTRAEFLFTNHWMTPPGALFKAIRRHPGVCIVQRIDGAAQDYGRDEPDADRTQAAVNRLADLTIFQSRYSRFATREKFPIIRHDGPVIWNPVDLGTFTPHGPARVYPIPITVAAVSWSANPRKGAASLYACAAQNPDIGFALCGNFADAPDLPNLVRPGVLGRAELAGALRGAAALLTFSENEACPNHVLEALACGRPALYLDSGAMAEVVGLAGLPVTVETFRPQLERLLADLADYQVAARALAESEFDPARVFPRYLAAMQAARRLRNPMRLAQRWLTAMRDGLSRLI